MLAQVFLCLLVLIFGIYIAYNFCEIKKISNSFNSYLNAINSLVKINSGDLKNTEMFQNKLNKVSLEGLRLLKHIFKFLIPFLICFLFLGFILNIKVSYFLIIIISSMPYLIILRNKK